MTKKKTVQNKPDEIPETSPMLDACTNELHFANMQIYHLMSILDELEAITGTLEKAVIKNAKERHELDKLIHAKKIHG